VHYWADLQSVLGFRCYDNIARTRNVNECLYLLYAWLLLAWHVCLSLFVNRLTRKVKGVFSCNLGTRQCTREELI